MSTSADLIHHERFTIRTYEIDNQKQATVPALVKLMHEAAMQQVIQLKLSVWDLEPENISWVLMRKYLQIERLPKLGETITIQTHPAGFEKFFTYRDYQVFDDDENRIAHSSSTWLLMDTQTRRMTRIPDFILDFSDQLPPPEACLPRPEDKLPPLEQVDIQQHFQVNWYDLDFNQHLNNALYVQWMLQTVPDDLLQNGQLKHLSVQYRAESHWKDQIIAETQQLSETHFLHRLKLQHSDKKLAFAETQWALTT